MAETPEEVFERVLAEEQAKGSSPAVAQSRAKAARMRASKGLPTDPAEAAKAAAGAAPAKPAAQEEPAEAPAAEAPAPAAEAEAPAAAAEAPARPAAAAASSGPSAPEGQAITAGEDPEAAYERVLKEEQAKGSSPAVAQSRAKAARMRAKKAAAGGAAAPAGAAKPAAAGAPAAAAAAPAAAAAGGRPSAGRAAATLQATPERVQRLLAVVKPEAIQRVEKEPMDRVNVWPHLMAAEFLSILAMTAFLVIFSTFVNAPFRELANINVTPNPSKAPWYFLGLQELLRYFHPQVAGVTIPQWLIVAAVALPFVDRNPSQKPADRKLAIVLFTIFFMMSAVLAILGSLFRGPGFNFIYPWDQGLFFEL